MFAINIRSLSIRIITTLDDDYLLCCPLTLWLQENAADRPRTHFVRVSFKRVVLIFKPRVDGNNFDSTCFFFSFFFQRAVPGTKYLSTIRVLILWAESYSATRTLRYNSERFLRIITSMYFGDSMIRGQIA